MTGEKLRRLGTFVSSGLPYMLPPEVRFVLVLACPAEQPTAELGTHTTTATNMSARDLDVVLSEVHAAVQANAEAIGPGRTVDATPKGPAS
jgi:hypothetical protein